MGKITRRGSLALAAAVATTLSVVPAATAASDNIGIPISGQDVARVEGQDRVRTSVQASRLLTGAAGWNGDTVIIARSSDYPDALASAALADQLNAPVVLNDSHVLNNYVKAELERLYGIGVRNVIIVGGTDAIHASVEAAIKGLKTSTGESLFTGGEDRSVERIAGGDRYETAVELAIATQAVRDGNEALAADLEDAEAELERQAGAERAADEAYDALVKAWNAYKAAQDATARAEAELAELQAERTKLTAQLVEVAGAPTQAEINAASDAVVAAQEDVDEAQAAWNAVTETIVNLDPVYRDELEGPTTLMSEAIQSLSEADQVIAQAALAALSLDGTATLEAFRAAGFTATAEDGDLTVAIATEEGELVAAQEALDALVVAAAEAAEAEESNAAVLEQLTALAGEIDAAQAAVDTAEDAEEQALTDYGTAEQAWRQALDALPSPEEREAAEAELQAAREALMASTELVLLTTGRDFADALSAGAVAGEHDGVVLLTAGNVLVDTTAEYLDATEAPVDAIGGPSAAAIGVEARDKIAGADRYETAAMAAAHYFTDPLNVAVASGVNFPDAVSGAGFIANLDGPLVLTWPGALPQSTSDYFQFENSGWSSVFVFGGPSAISNDVVSDLADMQARGVPTDDATID